MENSDTNAPINLSQERVLIVAESATLLTEGAPLWLDGADIAFCDNPDEIMETLIRFQPTVAFLVYADTIPKAAMKQIVDFPSLKWVSNAGSGIEHLTPWDPNQVTVTNAAGVLSEFLAEFVLSAIQMANIGFPQITQRQRQAEWQPHTWTPLAGKTLAVVGLGQVGKAVARKARAVGMTVIGSRAREIETPEVDEVFGPERFCNLMARAHFVSVHTASTPETKDLIDQSAFACMRKDVVFLNMARGPVVNEAALIEALQNGKIKTAFLDVFDTEPLPQDHPFWAMDNVIVSPHMADNVPDWPKRMYSAFCENFQRYRRGEALQSVVDPTRGY